MLGTQLGRGGRVGGEEVKDVTNSAASGAVAREDKEADLADDERAEFWIQFLGLRFRAVGHTSLEG